MSKLQFSVEYELTMFSWKLGQKYAPFVTFFPMKTLEVEGLFKIETTLCSVCIWASCAVSCASHTDRSTRHDVLCGTAVNDCFVEQQFLSSSHSGIEELVAAGQLLERTF